MEKIKACIRDSGDMTKIEVKDENELQKVAKKIDSPVIECDKDGYDAVIDGRNKTMYYVSKK